MSGPVTYYEPAEQVKAESLDISSQEKPQSFYQRAFSVFFNTQSSAPAAPAAALEKPHSSSRTDTKFLTISQLGKDSSYTDIDNDYDVIEVRQLSYAEVANASKLMYPQPTDKPSETIYVPVPAVADDQFDSELEEDQNAQSWYQDGMFEQELNTSTIEEYPTLQDKYINTKKAKEFNNRSTKKTHQHNNVKKLKK